MSWLRVTISSLFYLSVVPPIYSQSSPQTSAGSGTDSQCQSLKERADEGDKLSDAQQQTYSRCLLENRIRTIGPHPTFVPVIEQFQLNGPVPLGNSNGHDGKMYQ